MIDAHAHLDAVDDPSATLARAREAGVSRVVTVGTGIASCRVALALAEREDGVFAALGIHPHDAGSDDAERIDELRELLSDDRAVAVGETGLDFYRDYAPHDLQQRLFERHLEVAGELGLPVVIHCREAEEATVPVGGASERVGQIPDHGLVAAGLDRDRDMGRIPAAQQRPQPRERRQHDHPHQHDEQADRVRDAAEHGDRQLAPGRRRIGDAGREEANRQGQQDREGEHHRADEVLGPGGERDEREEKGRDVRHQDANKHDRPGECRAGHPR